LKSFSCSEEDGDGFMGGILNIPTCIYTALNLVVLYFILKKLLFKPVSEFMEKRANSIREAIDKAESDKLEALEMKNKYDKELKDVKDKAQKIIMEAQEKAQLEYEKIIQKARDEAEKIMEEADREVERQRIENIKNVREEIVNLALEAASKVIECNMDTKENRELVNRFIDERIA
jgi:F-type H+-transporting ATPase subunit b